MAAEIMERCDDVITVQFQVKLSRSSMSMLDCEEAIQTSLNEAGALATKAALEAFDADGSSFSMGTVKWYPKGKQRKDYQTPYGEVAVERYVYQTCQGGQTFCPLDTNARIVVSSTPRLAKQISHKYAEMPSARVVFDLAENHGRRVSRSLVQDLAGVVAGVVQAESIDLWGRYTPPRLKQSVSTLVFGLDTTHQLPSKNGPRVTMVGSVAFYGRTNEPLHTTYIAFTSDGEKSFWKSMQKAISQTKDSYPDAYTLGMVDGASDNQQFLEPQVDKLLIDFWHVKAQVAKAAKVIYSRDPVQRQDWQDERRRRLERDSLAVRDLLSELESIDQSELSDAARDDLRETITFFQDHRELMDYTSEFQNNRPIGTGVAEEASKTIFKTRFRRLGRKKWETGFDSMLSLRALIYTRGLWDKFWAKISRKGLDLGM